MERKRKISIIGLGYVGLSISVAFGKVTKVIAFDIDRTRIDELKKGKDRNNEISKDTLKKGNILFTSNPKDLKKADFHIIAVPTPVDRNKNPDLEILLNATKTVGEHIKKADIIVYESTVYPGVTEEICIPLLEKTSKLRCGKDFKVGYSPERINPSDKKHTIENVKKIISAIDNPTLNIIASVYKSIIMAGVHLVSSIKVAEATKVLENTQRDLNIALMNEMALIFHTLKINISEALEAAETKWNFIPFRPGLVGGHCVGVNSYLLAHKSEEMGYYPALIHAGRRINDLFPKFIARETIKKMISLNVNIKRARIAVLGFTYKENCSDYRDTKVIDLINELKSFETEVLVHDPIADPYSVTRDYGINLVSWENLINLQAIIVAVSHKEYFTINKKGIEKKFNGGFLLMDIKGVFNPEHFKDTKMTLWKI